MRLSCNGCRVLRKGCSDDCTIRPCLEWIKSPDSQSNATLFLAKFYGRTGLLNLINSGSPDVRPAIFKSLLHEACGRIVNPIHGSVGLMCTGNWNLCQTAVQAVLNGTPITQMTIDQTKTGPAVKGFDIRHVNKVEKTSGSSDLSRVRSRCRFKRTGCKVKRSPVSVGSGESDHEVMMNNKRSPSHDSSLSHQSEHVAESVRLPSAEIVEPEARAGSEPNLCERRADDGEIELELTLRL